MLYLRISIQVDRYHCNPELPGDHVRQLRDEQHHGSHSDRSLGHPRYVFGCHDNLLLRQVGTQARDCVYKLRDGALPMLTTPQYISYGFQLTGCLLVVVLWARFEAGGSSNASMGKAVIGVMYLVCLGFSGPMNAFIATV